MEHGIAISRYHLSPATGLEDQGADHAPPHNAIYDWSVHVTALQQDDTQRNNASNGNMTNMIHTIPMPAAQ